MVERRASGGCPGDRADLEVTNIHTGQRRALAKANPQEMAHKASQWEGEKAHASQRVTIGLPI